MEKQRTDFSILARAYYYVRSAFGRVLPQSQSKEPSGSERRSNGAEAGGAGAEMEPEMGLAEHRARQRGQARAAADALPRLSLD